MRIAGRDILLPTTMVGSWPRPLWLRGGVLRQSPYEVDFPDMYQRTLYEDAVRLAVKDQDLAGLDIVTDGNQYFEGETPYDKIQMLLVPLRLHGFRGYGPPGAVPGMEQYFRPVVHDRVRWVRPVFGPVLGAVQDRHRQAVQDQYQRRARRRWPRGARTSGTATTRRCGPTSPTRSTASCAGSPTTAPTSSSSPSRPTSRRRGARSGRWT